jgi:hypothetical protein
MVNIAKGPDEELVLVVTAPAMARRTGAGIGAEEFGRFGGRVRFGPEYAASREQKESGNSGEPEASAHS